MKHVVTLPFFLVSLCIGTTTAVQHTDILSSCEPELFEPYSPYVKINRGQSFKRQDTTEMTLISTTRDTEPYSDRLLHTATALQKSLTAFRQRKKYNPHRGYDRAELRAKEHAIKGQQREIRLIHEEGTPSNTVSNIIMLENQRHNTDTLTECTNLYTQMLKIITKELLNELIEHRWRHVLYARK